MLLAFKAEGAPGRFIPENWRTATTIPAQAPRLNARASQRNMEERQSIKFMTLPPAALNRQWAVTNKVIEELHPHGCGYWIGRGRDLTSVGHFPLQHMAEKDWVDLDAFIEAWLVALKLWAIPADPKPVAASIERARRQRERAM